MTAFSLKRTRLPLLLLSVALAYSTSALADYTQEDMLSFEDPSWTTDAEGVTLELSTDYVSHGAYGMKVDLYNNTRAVVEAALPVSNLLPTGDLDVGMIELDVYSPSVPVYDYLGNIQLALKSETGYWGWVGQIEVAESYFNESGLTTFSFALSDQSAALLQEENVSIRLTFSALQSDTIFYVDDFRVVNTQRDIVSAAVCNGGDDKWGGTFLWDDNTYYGQGDQVVAVVDEQLVLYECKADENGGPTTNWCNLSAYAPGYSSIWRQAWTQRGICGSALITVHYDEPNNHVVYQRHGSLTEELRVHIQYKPWGLPERLTAFKFSAGSSEWRMNAGGKSHFGLSSNTTNYPGYYFAIEQIRIAVPLAHVGAHYEIDTHEIVYRRAGSLVAPLTVHRTYRPWQQEEPEIEAFTFEAGVDEHRIYAEWWTHYGFAEEQFDRVGFLPSQAEQEVALSNVWYTWDHNTKEIVFKREGGPLIFMPIRIEFTAVGIPRRIIADNFGVNQTEIRKSVPSLGNAHGGEVISMGLSGNQRDFPGYYFEKPTYVDQDVPW